MSNYRAIEQRNRAVGFLLMPVAFFVVVSLATCSVNDYPNSSLGPDEVLNAGGYTGAVMAYILFVVFGYGAYGIPVIIGFWGWNRLYNGPPRLLISSLLVGSGLIMAGATTVSLVTSLPADTRFAYGGALGLHLGQRVTQLVGTDGAFFVSAAFFAGMAVLVVFWGIRRRAAKHRTSSRVYENTTPVSPSSLV